MTLIFLKIFSSEKVLVKSLYLRKKEKRFSRGNTLPLFSPTTPLHPTPPRNNSLEIITPKKNHPCQYHPIKLLYSLKPHVQKKPLRGKIKSI
jgi:hypothetical protein